MPHPFNLTATTSADLTAEQYIADRLEQYQSWYDGKARKTKVRYLRMRTVTVVGGACVPALVNLNFEYVRFFATLVSLMVVVFVSLESVFHYREQWKNYRSTEQILGHEKVFYKARTGSYGGLNDRDAFRLLVDRTEGAIAAENAATLNVMTISSEEAITAGK